MPKSLASALLPAPFVLCAATAQLAPPSERVVPYPIDLPAGFQQAIVAGTRTTTGRPGPKYWTNTARYDLAIDVDPQKARLTGTAKMTYVNRSPDELGELVVHLYQDLQKAGQPRTRFVGITNGFELGEVRVDGAAVRARARDTQLRIRLPEPLPAGGERTIEIDYAFDIPKAGDAPRMGHEGADVVYLGYWYPQFAVYDDVEGWVADPYRGNGEFYMDYADYELAVTVPVGYLVRATGGLQNADEVLTEKARRALAAAADSHEVVHVVDADDLAKGTATASSANGKLTWRYHAEHVRDAAVSIGRTYLWDATHAIVKDKFGPGQDGTCMIHAVYEANAGDWVRGAEYAQHTIEFMSRMVHPYPWPHMTACEGIIGGGMEFPMMTIIGGRRPAGTIAHELIHMWFPMLVGSNEKRCAWQDEGFTSFWTTLCRDDLTGGENGPRGDILRAAAVIARGGDVVCMRHADAYGEDNFGFASYSKPAAILHQLRGLLGDKVFFAAFRRYAADWAFKHPYPYDFFRTFSDVSGQDLEPYFRMWFFEAWPLDHAIANVDVEGGSTVVTIDDKGRVLQPCTVEVTLQDGAKLRQSIPAATWWRGRKATLRFAGEAVDVQIDPGLTTIDVDRDNNRWRASEAGR